MQTIGAQAEKMTEKRLLNGLKPEWEELLKGFKKTSEQGTKMRGEGELLPPWLQFGYPRISIGWRMGPGEDYMAAFRSRFSALSPRDHKAFQKRYPEPEEWMGFYSLIRD